jgi:hypothetical protein
MDEDVDVGELVDKLRIKLGAERVFRMTPVESDVPERASKRVPAMAKVKGAAWPDDLPRPSRLLTPPELVNALAEIPDAPPRFFVWRKMRHNVVKADGPERILGESWASDQEIGLQRDYYRVEMCKASTSGYSGMRRLKRGRVGGCMASVKHETHAAQRPIQQRLSFSIIRLVAY